MDLLFFPFPFPLPPSPSPSPSPTATVRHSISHALQYQLHLAAHPAVQSNRAAHQHGHPETGSVALQVGPSTPWAVKNDKFELHHKPLLYPGREKLYRFPYFFFLSMWMLFLNDILAHFYLFLRSIYELCWLFIAGSNCHAHTYTHRLKLTRGSTLTEKGQVKEGLLAH